MDNQHNDQSTTLKSTPPRPINAESVVSSNLAPELQGKGNAQTSRDQAPEPDIPVILILMRRGGAKKMVGYISGAMLLLGALGMIIPSYSFVNTLSVVFLFGGPVIALFLGFIVGRLVFTKVKAKSISGTDRTAQSPSSIIKAVILAVAAFVAVFTVYAGIFFITAMYLSVRACELSGSSKCY